MPLAFLAGFLIPYLPYLSAGTRVIGYLPNYFKEQFNPGVAYFISEWVKQAGGKPEQIVFLLLLVALAAIYLVAFLRPNTKAEDAIRRCIWPIGAFTLLTRNLFPWYLLWLVPLVAIFLILPTALQQARPTRLPLNSWTGWWLFSGLIALAYTFFIDWKPIPLAAGAEFLPLYIFLFIDLARFVWQRTDWQLRQFSGPKVVESSKVK